MYLHLYYPDPDFSPIRIRTQEKWPILRTKGPGFETLMWREYSKARQIRRYLGYMLRDQEEVVPVPLGDGVVHDGPRGRVADRTTVVDGEVSVVNPTKRERGGGTNQPSDPKS